MSILFQPDKIGSLELPNRLARSATAERMATPEGYVTPKLIELYEDLAHGGVGLIITGHMYVHPSGKCHPEMTAVYDDRFLPGLTELADAIHNAGGKAVVQINHGGMQCSQETVDQLISSSDVRATPIPINVDLPIAKSTKPVPPGTSHWPLSFWPHATNEPSELMATVCHPPPSAAT